MNNENHEHCKKIALELEQYANGEIYRCPECDETFMEDDVTSDDNDTCICPHCKETISIHDLDQLGLYDYFADCLDIEYRVGLNHDKIHSVRIMVTCGGPNIYIDTATKAVELYWWGDRASYSLDIDVCEQIDAWAEDLWRC